MALKIIGIGEIGYSNGAGDTIKTMGLGSCIAVIFYAPKLNLVGMAHVALPDSTIASDRAKKLPGYFADTAIPLLVKKFKAAGVTKRSELVIKLAGGASIMDPNGVFNIGKRNILAIRKILWQNRLGAIAEDVGKNFSRTVWTEAATGKVFISSPRKGVYEL